MYFCPSPGHLILITGANLVVMQIGVSLAGFAAMTAVAYYISWSHRQDLPAALLLASLAPVTSAYSARPTAATALCRNKSGLKRLKAKGELFGHGERHERCGRKVRHGAAGRARLRPPTPSLKSAYAFDGDDRPRCDPPSTPSRATPTSPR